MADKNQYIQTAYDDLKMLSANEQKRLAYEERLKAERDYISFAYDNWERGLKQGIQVKTIGLILKKMAKGLTVEETAELTEEDASFVSGSMNAGRIILTGRRKRLPTACWMRKRSESRLTHPILRI